VPKWSIKEGRQSNKYEPPVNVKVCGKSVKITRAEPVFISLLAHGKSLIRN
jgi:hypothetical protein